MLAGHCMTRLGDVTIGDTQLDSDVHPVSVTLKCNCRANTNPQIHKCNQIKLTRLLFLLSESSILPCRLSFAASRYMLVGNTSPEKWSVLSHMSHLHGVSFSVATSRQLLQLGS